MTVIGSPKIVKGNPKTTSNSPKIATGSPKTISGSPKLASGHYFFFGCPILLGRARKWLK
jgi:hypothetical protein